MVVIEGGVTFACSSGHESAPARIKGIPLENYCCFCLLSSSVNVVPFVIVVRRQPNHLISEIVGPKSRHIMLPFPVRA